MNPSIHSSSDDCVKTGKLKSSIFPNFSIWYGKKFKKEYVKRQLKQGRRIMSICSWWHWRARGTYHYQHSRDTQIANSSIPHHCICHHIHTLCTFFLSTKNDSIPISSLFTIKQAKPLFCRSFSHYFFFSLNLESFHFSLLLRRIKVSA